jgi:MFS family permease
MSYLPFFLASFTWNYGLGMTYVVVPLYAHHLGLSGAQIGTLFSTPVLIQMAVNLAGGAYADRVGGRRMMLVSSLLMALAALGFLGARGFWMLLAGQVVMVVSRATFWPATWSMASELPGERSVQLGRLNSITNLGQIIGTGSCGFVMAFAGYSAAFAVLAGAGIATWALGLPGRRAAHRPRHGGGVFAAYRPLLGEPIIYYAVMCAYLSALPISLSMSFYPLLLEHYGHGEEAAGMLIALRAVGAISAGLLAARWVTSGPASPWPIYAGLAVVLSVGAMPLIPSTLPTAALMLLAGLGSGLMTLYFQITISEASGAERRGSAMALGGLGWGLSHFSTPLIMGVLADRFGIVAGFYVLGVLGLGFVVTIALVRRWAFSGRRR